MFLSENDCNLLGNIYIFESLLCAGLTSLVVNRYVHNKISWTLRGIKVFIYTHTYNIYTYSKSIKVFYFILSVILRQQQMKCAEWD